MSEPEATPAGDIVNRLGTVALLVVDAMRRSEGERPPIDAEAVVALLNFADGQRIEELRKALLLSQPGVAHLVGRLEGEGLARRERDEADRRGVRVHLTGAGRAEAHRILERREAAVRDCLAELSPDDAAGLRRVLDHILVRATETPDDANRLCRLCDGDACGHPDHCPVTLRATELLRAQGREPSEG